MRGWQIYIKVNYGVMEDVLLNTFSHVFRTWCATMRGVRWHVSARVRAAFEGLKPFKDRKATTSARNFSRHNFPSNRARELFKPSKKRRKSSIIHLKIQGIFGWRHRSLRKNARSNFFVFIFQNKLGKNPKYTSSEPLIGLLVLMLDKFWPTLMVSS